MTYGSVLVAIGNLRVNTHFSAILCCDGKVGEMCLGNGEEGHVAKDAAWSPVVVVVEVAAWELRHDAHGKLLLLLLHVDEVGDVEQGGVVSRAPFARLLAVYPEVVAIEHTIEAHHNVHSSPLVGNGERGAVVARQRIGTVILRFAETVRFPAPWHGYFPPSAILGWHGSVFTNTIYNLQAPFAIKTLHHLSVSYRQNVLKTVCHLRIGGCCDDDCQ